MPSGIARLHPVAEARQRARHRGAQRAARAEIGVPADLAERHHDRDDARSRRSSSRRKGWQRASSAGDGLLSGGAQRSAAVI